MKYLSLLFIGFLIAFSACNSDDDDPQLVEDIMIIEQYLLDNNITAQSTPSGLHYTINTVGNGEHPSTRSNITISYKGYLLDGTVFDETPGTTSRTFLLQNLIQGWQEGVPLLSKGGSGTFFLPSKLGYGSQGSSNIPSNSVIIFEIDLVDWE